MGVFFWGRRGEGAVQGRGLEGLELRAHCERGEGGAGGVLGGLVGRGWDLCGAGQPYPAMAMEVPEGGLHSRVSGLASLPLRSHSSRHLSGLPTACHTAPPHSARRRKLSYRHYSASPGLSTSAARACPDELVGLVSYSSEAYHYYCRAVSKDFSAKAGASVSDQAANVLSYSATSPHARDWKIQDTRNGQS